MNKTTVHGESLFRALTKIQTSREVMSRLLSATSFPFFQKCPRVSVIKNLSARANELPEFTCSTYTSVPSFRFSFRGSIRTYPRSGFRSGGTSAKTTSFGNHLLGSSENKCEVAAWELQIEILGKALSSPTHSHYLHHLDIPDCFTRHLSQSSKPTRSCIPPRASTPNKAWTNPAESVCPRPGWEARGWVQGGGRGLQLLVGLFKWWVC